MHRCTKVCFPLLVLSNGSALLARVQQITTVGSWFGYFYLALFADCPTVLVFLCSCVFLSTVFDHWTLINNFSLSLNAYNVEQTQKKQKKPQKKPHRRLLGADYQWLQCHIFFSRMAWWISVRFHLADLVAKLLNSFSRKLWCGNFFTQRLRKKHPKKKTKSPSLSPNHRCCDYCCRRLWKLTTCEVTGDTAGSSTTITTWLYTSSSSLNNLCKHWCNKAERLDNRVLGLIPVVGKGGFCFHLLPERITCRSVHPTSGSFLYTG